MTFMPPRPFRASAPVTGAGLVSRSRLLATLIAGTLALGLAGQLPRDATAAGGAGPAEKLRVGHTVKRIVVPGSTSAESRLVDVHLWYPADHKELSASPKTFYTSTLNDRPLPSQWTPLTWTVGAEIAREGAAIDPRGKPFPVIVFSHGNVNDPIDYAHTLELIAGAGFVVAAPYHVNNSQDDVRIDFINTQAGFQWFPCNDGRPPPCSRPDVPRSMEDRVRDIDSVLDNLPSWFGNRVDVSRAGVLGHSRGTVTALAAAGGSIPWGFEAEARVDAIMGMAIGNQTITFGANVANVSVPTLLVAGLLDVTSPHSVSVAAFEAIQSDEKALVSIENATHRSFDSTYCDQMQASGAIAQANPNAILDRHTIQGILNHPTSGRAMDYCSFASFTEPTDIRPLVASLANPPFGVTAGNVPTTGLDTDEVKQRMRKLAVGFFGKALKGGH
jgi:predicted dienelactone hydrolase